MKLFKGPDRPDSGFSLNPKKSPLFKSTKYLDLQVLICSPIFINCIAQYNKLFYDKNIIINIFIIIIILKNT